MVNRRKMFINLYFIFSLCVGAHSFKLQKVVMLGRHSIRAPLLSNLTWFTEKKWPDWSVDVGLLTEKGVLLERIMGNYFADWLMEKKLLNSRCPGNEVFVYANTKQRTRETAKAFVDGAFGECVQVYYKNLTVMDPVFNPIIRNTSPAFKEVVVNEMDRKLCELSLDEPLRDLENILDYRNSSRCKIDKQCDMVTGKNEIVFELNKEPDVTGPLMIANYIVDAFLMAYYEGKPLSEVAWGQISSNKQWADLMTIIQNYHDVRFKTKLLNKDVAQTLLKYMKDLFINGEKKFYLLVGHDANINSLLAALDFKDYRLHNQHESTPIGGKLVFQKWYDEVEERDLLQVHYMYQSSKQIRDATDLTQLDPPQWVQLELNSCVIDINGFCPWGSFIKIMNKL